MVFKSSSVGDSLAFGTRIAQVLKPRGVLILRGPLGAGKTIIVKGIAQALGVQDPIISPTYTVVVRYRGDDELLFYHVDLYRISGYDEFALLGGEEIVWSDGVVAIEWGDKIRDYLPPQTHTLEIQWGSADSRHITFTGSSF